jgi:hypothetical protein
VVGRGAAAGSIGHACFAGGWARPPAGRLVTPSPVVRVTIPARLCANADPGASTIAAKARPSVNLRTY